VAAANSAAQVSTIAYPCLLGYRLSLFHVCINEAMKYNIRLVALDLDGTTLNNNHELSEKTIKTLRRISSKVIICIATGRAISAIKDYANILNLQIPVPIIGFNGTFGFMKYHNDENPAKVFSIPMRENYAREVLNFCSKHGVLAQYYNGETGEIFAVPTKDEHYAFVKRYSNLIGKSVTFIESYEDVTKMFPTAKILVMTNDPDTLLLTAKNELNPDSFNILKGSDYFIEFLEAGISKGHGLKEMCKIIGKN